MRLTLPSNKEPIRVSLDVAPPTGPGQYGPPELKDFDLPIFERGDWVKWRKAIDESRVAQAVEGLTKEERTRALMAYPVRPLTNMEMRRYLDTDEGTGYVFRVCAKRGGVPEHAIKRIVDEGHCDEMDLEQVALLLAGIVDPQVIARELAKKRGDVPPDESDAATAGDPPNSSEDEDPLAGAPA